MTENISLPKLQISNLQKSFRKKKVLRDINLTACGGQCIGILGANGCGKSTLLSILAGIQKPDSGVITLDGKTMIPVKNSKAVRNSIGYVPQDSPLIAELNAYDNLKLWYCDSPLCLEDELDSGFLAMLGIPDFINIPVRHMSGGMKKRLSIGCSIAQNPRILLLDEPGAALDLICKERIEMYLRHYKKAGNLILIATHEEREIAECDALFILKDGILSPYTYDGNIHALAGRL